MWNEHLVQDAQIANLQLQRFQTVVKSRDLKLQNASEIAMESPLKLLNKYGRHSN